MPDVEATDVSIADVETNRDEDEFKLDEVPSGGCRWDMKAQNEDSRVLGVCSKATQVVRQLK